MRSLISFRLSVVTTAGACTALLTFALPMTAQQHPRVRLTFVATAPSDSAAVREYRNLWDSNEQRIVATMERLSGLRFVTTAYADTAIGVQVLESSANSGYRDKPMRMRSSYPSATKLATLIHEMGHRLQGDLFSPEEESHDYLFLWLYDVWVALEGREWADRQVAVERQRGQRYIEAWDKALALTPGARAQRWRAVLAERRPVPPK